MERPIQPGDRITDGKITGTVIGTTTLPMGCGSMLAYRVQTPAGTVEVIAAIYARKEKK